MNIKIFKVFHRPTIKLPVIKRFIHDYGFPIAITIIFLVVVAVSGLYRASQNSSLAELLTEVSSRGQGYGTLLSKDKSEELKKNDDTDQPTTGTPVGTPSSFALNTTNSATPAGTATGGGAPAAVPVSVFSVAIAGFQQTATTLECSTPKPKAQTCSKRYAFNAVIRANNGPGTVRYGWRSNLQAAIADGSVSVGGGDAQTSLQKVITLECNSPANVSLQFVITSPSVTQSAVLNINHNCNDI